MNVGLIDVIRIDEGRFVDHYTDPNAPRSTRLVPAAHEDMSQRNEGGKISFTVPVRWERRR